MSYFETKDFHSVYKMRVWIGCLVCVLLCLPLSSCGDDDKEELGGEESAAVAASLNVDKDQIELGGQQGKTETFSIKSNTSWHIEGTPEWLDLSSLSGSGDATVTVTTLSANNDPDIRTATLKVIAGDLTCEVAVTQLVVGTLNIDTNKIELGGQQGESGTFIINSNTSWRIEGAPEWLELSSLSGTGDAAVAVTTLSANSSYSVRVALLKVISGDLTCKVTVTQLSALNACTVEASEVVVLCDNAAWSHVFGSKATGYYEDIYAVSDLDGVSDEDLIETLKMSEPEEAPNDFVYYRNSGALLTPETQYVICTLGVDENGKTGDLKKTYFTTSKKTTDVLAEISNLKYTTKWEWDVTMTAYCARYYLLAYGDDDLFYEYLYVPNVYYAWLMTQKKEVLDFYSDSDHWWLTNTYYNDAMVVTWGVDKRTGNFSGVMDRAYWSRSFSSSVNKRTATPSTEKIGRSRKLSLDKVRIIPCK